MFWLLALGAVALLACAGSSGSDKTRNAASKPVEAPLTPGEIAVLEDFRRRVAHADEERHRSASAHVTACQDLEDAQRQLRTARWLFACLFIVASAIWLVLFRYALHGAIVRAWVVAASIVVMGLFSSGAYVIRGLRQIRDRARYETQSSSVRWAEARQRFDDVSKAATRAREMAMDHARRRAQALIEAQKKRAEEERRAEEFAAWVEKQQSAAARAVEDEQRQFAAFVKEALYHALRVAPDPKRFIAVHRDALLAKRDRIRGAYVSGQVLGSTGDECLKLAERALRELPHEVAYWYPRSKDRTTAKLAHAFRVYSGAFREVMLPLALEQQAAKEQRRQLPVKAPRRKRTELERLLAAMPAEVSQRAVEGATSALAVNALTEFSQRALDGERASLERRGVRREVVQRQLETMRENLEKSASEFAGERGLISGELE